MTYLLPSPQSESAGREPSSDTRRPIIIGLTIVLLFFGGFGAWAALAPLHSAAIAPGVVAVDSNRKTVQHLEGGIIKEILVRDGDTVERDQVLVRLDETRSAAALGVLEGQYRADRALEARLIAERDGLHAITFDDELVAAAGEPEIAEIIAGQEGLFETRRAANESQIGVLHQQIKQLEEEIGGFKSQRQAKARQLELVQEEYGAVKELYDKGYERKPRLLALQRAAALLEGERGQYAAQIARAKQDIGEAEIRILALNDTFRRDVETELREVQVRVAELRDRLASQRDVLQRVDIVAPQAGVVVGLKFHTTGGVVRPGDPILDIVPTSDELIVEARVRAEDIDVVHPGLPAQVRLSAYRQRTTPYVDGRVVQVSADRFVDERSGVPYYAARVAIDGAALARLEGVTLYPGMPVEVMIETGSRKAIDYLLSPITSSIHRAFREQ